MVWYILSFGSPTESPPIAMPVQGPNSITRSKDSVRSAGNVPPWRIGHNVWRIGGWSDGRMERSADSAIRRSANSRCLLAHRSSQRIPSDRLVRASGNHVIEGHGDVGTERPLNLNGTLGGQCAPAAVDVALKLDAVLVDFPEALEGEDLKAARVREQ